MRDALGGSDADAMRWRAAAWARGAEAGRDADRARWAVMSPAERVDEALELIEASERMTTGLRGGAPRATTQPF